MKNYTFDLIKNAQKEIGNAFTASELLKISGGNAETFKPVMDYLKDHGFGDQMANHLFLIARDAVQNIIASKPFSYCDECYENTLLTVTGIGVFCDDCMEELNIETYFCPVCRKRSTEFDVCSNPRCEER